MEIVLVAMKSERKSPSLKKKQTAQLVLAALCDLRNRGRVSVKKVVSHITNEYCVPIDDFVKYIPSVIDSGMAFGAIKAKKGGLLSVGSVTKTLINRPKKQCKKKKQKKSNLKKKDEEEAAEKKCEDDKSLSGSENASTILIV